MASREEQFKQRRVRALAEAHIQKAIQAGDPRVFPMDRFGAPCIPGSKILYRPDFDFVYEVLEVAPVLDPGAPSGMIKVTMVTETTIVLRAGQLAMNMVRIGVAAPEAEAVPSDAPSEELPEVAPPAGPRLVSLTDAQ